MGSYLVTTYKIIKIILFTPISNVFASYESEEGISKGPL
jgi:hypothetical protein